MNRILRAIVKKNCNALDNSAMDFETLYQITFQNAGIMAEDTDGFRINTHTYAAVRARIESVSCALYKKIGATHGYVALAMENSIDWIVAFWAILRSGNKPYLVNCRHPEALANSALKTLNIRYIIGKAQPGLQGEFIDIATLTCADSFAGEFENEIALSTSATSLKEVLCFYTGKQLSAQILNVKGILAQYPEISEAYKGKIKLLAFLPFYHIFGLIAVYFWFTFFGQTIVFLKDLSSETILKTCRKHEVTHIFAVPLLWHTIENSVWKAAARDGEKNVAKLKRGLKLCTALQNLFPHLGMHLAQRILHQVTDRLFGRSVRFCITGGSAIRASALALFNGIGYNLHNGYGMSEIGITSVELRTRPKHKNQGSVGKPFTSVEYKTDQNGVLSVKGTSICSKLWINGVAQPMDGWFETGDVIEEANGYYYIKGRLGDMIIGENGENINPDVIEQHFALPKAENICVLGLENEGKQVTSLVVQLSAYLSVAAKNDLLDKIIACNQTLPLTAQVQKIYCTTDTLRTPEEIKISRTRLRRAIADKTILLTEFKKDTPAAQAAASYSPALLEKVTDIVARVLDVPAATLDIHAHLLLDLGADSMQYFSILSALAEEFSVGTPEKDVLCYTIHEICQYIERHI